MNFHQTDVYTDSSHCLTLAKPVRQAQREREIERERERESEREGE